LRSRDNLLLLQTSTRTQVQVRTVSDPNRFISPGPEEAHCGVFLDADSSVAADITVRPIIRNLQLFNGFKQRVLDKPFRVQSPAALMFVHIQHVLVHLVESLRGPHFGGFVRAVKEPVTDWVPLKSRHDGELVVNVLVAVTVIPYVDRCDVQDVGTQHCHAIVFVSRVVPVIFHDLETPSDGVPHFQDIVRGLGVLVRRRLPGVVQVRQVK